MENRHDDWRKELAALAKAALAGECASPRSNADAQQPAAPAPERRRRGRPPRAAKRCPICGGMIMHRKDKYCSKECSDWAKVKDPTDIRVEVRAARKRRVAFLASLPRDTAARKTRMSHDGRCMIEQRGYCPITGTSSANARMDYYKVAKR